MVPPVEPGGHCHQVPGPVIEGCGPCGVSRPLQPALSGPGPGTVAYAPALCNQSLRAAESYTDLSYSVPSTQAVLLCP